MAELSFRQKAAQQAAINLRTRLVQGAADQPFSATIGSISIALRVCVGRPRFMGPDGLLKWAGSDLVVVALAMSNAAGASSMRYMGWSDGSGDQLNSRNATLSDNIGNHYALAMTDRGLERWVGQISGSRSVAAGETLSDVLVFGAPIANATKLILDLPRINWGLGGTLHLELPVARISHFPTNAA